MCISMTNVRDKLTFQFSSSHFNKKINVLKVETIRIFRNQAIAGNRINQNFFYEFLFGIVWEKFIWIE